MSFIYNIGASKIGEWAEPTGILRAILVKSDYADVANRDHDWVSQLNATANPAFGATAELTASAGYVRGFGGSGRLVISGIEVIEDDANDRAIFRANRLLWTLMTTTERIAALVLAVPKTADADSYLVGLFDGSPFPTPVGGITAQDLLLKWANDDGVRGDVFALPTV